MRNGLRNVLACGAAVAALTIGAQSALAGGFALREQSAQGLGVSFAGAAAGGAGLSSMFWNPATMTQHEGVTSTYTATGIFPYAQVSPDLATSGFMKFVAGGSSLSAGGTGDIAQDALTVASSSAYQVTKNLWLGLSVNAPFGLVTKTPTNWAGQLYARTSKVFSTEITPSVAYKINDMVSVGLGLRVMYFKTSLSSAYPSNPAVKATALLPNAPTATVKGDDWALGWSAGVTLTPLQGTEIGVGYRSQVKPNLDGTMSTPFFAFPIKSKIALPDQVTVGLRQRINDRFTVLAGYEWTHWSVLKSFPVMFTGGPFAGAKATDLSFRYKDGWMVSLGGEYKYDDRWTLRAGMAYEKSPVDISNRSPRLPDDNRIWANVGFSYQVNNKLNLDFAYAHVFAKSASINIGPGHPAYQGAPFVAKSKTHLDIVSAGLTYRWDEPSAPSNLPLVRKY